jgi:cobalt-precorrin 5A hydrolase/precorrin-3B C17-methyltransferase
MIKDYRSLNTPVLLARQLGRNEERVNLYSLEDCPLHEVDMLTTILIGNTQSFVKGDHFVTPRGY